MKLITVFTVMSCAFVQAETYLVPIRDLKFENKTEDLIKLLDGRRIPRSWSRRSEPNMSVRTPEGVLAYMAPEKVSGKEMRGDVLIAIDSDKDRQFSAQLDIQNMSKYWHNLEVSRFKFSFDPKNHKPVAENEVERIKKAHYHSLAESGYLGSPWFNEMADVKYGRSLNMGNVRTEFSLFTGGRAILDNLALDRELKLMKDDVDAKVDINSLIGITTEEIDWKDLMPKEEVAIDSLAMLVPEDQHVLICPSLVDMNKIVYLIEKEGSPLAQGFSVRNPFRRLPTKYKKQLGLDFPAAFAKLVPAKSVAVTGYDPFFPTGTDVAVLLETDSPEILFKMLDEAIKSPEKNIALVGKVVVIANSKAQLTRIQEVHVGKIKSLGSLDEYKFFRHRYPIAEKKTGFVFLSDACIRRWGGPRLRIAASRRTKSVAALNYLTARSLSKKNVVELNEDQKFLLGDVVIKDDAIESDKMGSLQYMTPTIEMQLDMVTQTEADAYKAWKSDYEKGWRNVFDPIGFSFQIDDDTKEVDLTVMPLTVDNDYYRTLLSIVGKSVLSRDARISDDGHVMSVSIAVDKDARENNQVSSWISGMTWLGDSITFFAGKDDRWDSVENSKSRFEDVILSSIGLRVKHTSQTKLAAYLLFIRGQITRYLSSYDFKWKVKKYGGKNYVAISSNLNLGIDGEQGIYYVVTKDLLIITLREDVLKREIDRQKKEKKEKLVLSSLQENADHLYIKSKSEVLIAFFSGWGGRGESLSDKRRVQSYRAIPILNEWRRMFKDKNPVEVHFTRFGEDIFCPGGKGYVWNAEEMTMESVVYGHATRPRKVEGDSSISDVFGELETSMKFEHDGLRLHLKINKAK